MSLLHFTNALDGASDRQRWNGGNILESFLEIIDHNKIKNHLIGVMDDETEAYLKVMLQQVLLIQAPLYNMRSAH